MNTRPGGCFASLQKSTKDINNTAENLAEDELYNNKYWVTLSFFLYTGSYATMIVKQFIKAALEETDA